MEKKKNKVGFSIKPKKIINNKVNTQVVPTNSSMVEYRHLGFNERNTYNSSYNRPSPLFEINYYRNMSMDSNTICIQDSLGMIHVPTFSSAYSRFITEPSLIIEVNYNYTDIPDVVVNRLKNLYESRHYEEYELTNGTKYIDIIRNVSSKNATSSWEVTFIYIIKHTDIMSVKSMYLPDIGIQVLSSIPHYQSDVFHPLYHHGAVFISEQMRTKLQDTMFSVKVIDNTSKENTPYYAKVGGVVYELLSKHSSLDEDGVYLTIIPPNQIYFNTQFVPLEDINSVGVYRDKIDAENGDEFSSKEKKRELLNSISELEKEIKRKEDILNSINDKIDKQLKTYENNIDKLEKEYTKKRDKLEEEYRDKKLKLMKEVEKYTENINREEKQYTTLIEKHKRSTKEMEERYEVKIKEYEDKIKEKEEKVKEIEKLIDEKEHYLAITDNTKVYNQKLKEISIANAKDNENSMKMLTIELEDIEETIKKGEEKAKEYIEYLNKSNDIKKNIQNVYSYFNI